MAVNINVPSQVKTYANLAAFPATGALKTIYIAEDTNKTYRWTGSVYVEVSASAASGITIGSTAIASGTVGRILFEGTGNVVQESGNLFWDNTNGMLGVGTSSPSNTFQVKSAAGYPIAFFSQNDLVNQGGIAIYQTQISSTAGNPLYLTATGTLFFESSGAEAGRFTSTTRNLLIGTTTDAGFKLDVNGTARVQGLIDSTNTFNSLGAFSTGIGLSKTTLNSSTNYSDVISVQGLARSLNNFAYRVYGVKGIGATDGLFGSQSIDIITGVQGSISVGNSNKTVTTAMSLYASAGTIGTGNTITNYYGAYLETPTGTGITNKWGLFQQDTTSKNYFGGNVLINTTTDAGFRLDVNGTARVVGTAVLGRVNFSSNDADGQLRFVGNSLVYNPTGSASLSSTSAAFELTSTTKGFLPPRMTTTQKNAIASPAAGLMVYDTTLNVISYYNGTMWI